MRLAIVLAAAALAVGGTAANAAYLSYSEWTSLTDRERTLYIAGAFDQLATIGGVSSDRSAASIAGRYQACIARAAMTDAQLAENVRGFAAVRSELQALPIPVALMQYLSLTCGSL
jgi:hypothetical protein